jgi:predicted phosphoribosyltransferase
MLARHLHACAGRRDVVVLALPRGGVPVGFEVARALAARMEVFFVRKLGVPTHEELAMGAIATGGILFLNEEVIQSLRIPRDAINAVEVRERRELARREHEYGLAGRKLELDGRVAILVDDGLATGSTMRAAIMAVQRQHPARVIVAVPVAARDTIEELEKHVDEVVSLAAPRSFTAVGAWYDDFSQTTDAEVRDLISRANLIAPSHTVSPEPA